MLESVSQRFGGTKQPAAGAGHGAPVAAAPHAPHEEH
jgi:hypothetical protein